IFKPYIKDLVSKRLEEFENDSKAAVTSLKKNPIVLREGVELTYGTCFTNEFVIKYPVQSIKSKDLDSVIDSKVREVLRARLEQFGNKEKEAFKDIEKNPVWFNKEKTLQLKPFVVLQDSRLLNHSAKMQVTYQMLLLNLVIIIILQFIGILMEIGNNMFAPFGML
ncbi:MAG: hypothetical protein HC830_12465, partial [Bacteroidetes bacterium]|nr:hypothetical protein [Bacteroidota bacterium]